jgi:LacI family transcriptional regulator
MNIYDIAKLSGVSIATVSRVVNGSDKVSPKTKQKVLDVIREEQYTPNVFARGLGLDSMNTVGIICPDVADAYMAKCVAILEGKLHEYNYDCILFCSGRGEEEKKKYTELILSKRIDALIMVGSAYAGHGEDSRETDYIRKAAQQVPVFIINGYVKGENIYCSYCDDRQAAYDAVSALIRRGKEKILFLSDSHSVSANLKMKGYEDALRDAGYPVRGELKVYTRNHIHTVRDLLLGSRNLEFDAVLATDDGMAVGAIKYAISSGRSIPEEISVVGFNNSNLAICCEPELTSIDNKSETLCYDTIDNLMKVLQGEADVPQKNEIKCSIVTRCTTDF